MHYRGVWRRRFARSGARLLSDTVTAYSLAICFDLFDNADDRAAAGQRIADLAAQNDYRITTGFVGTPLVCDALTTTGQVDVAYRLLLEQQCPSWLYPVTQGATTIWERWDSLMPDGRVNPSEMTSFNHYALGAVIDWMHRTIGGLAPLEPGYRTVLVRPLPGGGITSAQTRYDSSFGETMVSWELVGTHFACEVSVPPGAGAELRLPIDGWNVRRVGSGRYAFSGSVVTS
jgi:alpha-L-rhamnosidase